MADKETEVVMAGAPAGGSAAAPATGGWPLEHYRPALAKSLQERRQEYGDAFVAMLGGVLRRPASPGRTSSLGSVQTLDSSGVPGAALITDVWPVVRSGRSNFGHVTVGRTANNDIVLPDTSVSRFHAFFKRDGERFFVVDAGSRNGTRLNDMRVPAQGTGRPVELVGGVRICFGSVELVFLLAPQFWSIVATIFGE